MQCMAVFCVFGKSKCAANNAALGRISHYKKDPRLLEGDDYALSARLLCRSSES